ncbi:hypothetical protein [Pseudolactococcus insecticola]|uniref:Uncharacterized protein n=1 Tax=Pseudolactococcus insecticola TaxID=2709158 RepID=A0A6A0B2Y1_9LACT|nr:hypothetical protein [Lactococcus insecticola]GFH39679.1 hypothetical protein Hs20B_00770 [Lactococcus insecticola]
MFSGKQPTFVVLSSVGLLIYSAWQMINTILPNLQIFRVVYDTIANAINALRLQSSISMTNLQFLLYVVVLVAFIFLLAKFWKFAIYALLFIIFILVCNFVYFAWANGAASTDWFIFIVMVVSSINVFLTAKSRGFI